MRELSLVLILALASGCTVPDLAAPPPPVDAGATDVDLLLLRGEFRGIRPSMDMQRVAGRFPDLEGIAAGVSQAGLLISKEGFAILTDRSGGRVQAIWLEFAGTKRVPATALESIDGRIRSGATEADVLAYLGAHGIPILLWEFADEGSPGAPVIRHYFIDYAKSWIEVRDGVLMKAYTGDRHIYSQGRRAAEAQ